MSNAAIQIKSVPTFRELNGRFARASYELLEARRPMLREEGRRLVELMREEAPYKTGKFAKGIRYTTFNDGAAVGIRVGTPQPLGNYIIFGTKPHIIAAKNAKTLRFYWAKGPKGPGVYFYPMVHHPGTKPNQFNQRAYQRWIPNGLIALKRISTRFIKTIKGEQ